MLLLKVLIAKEIATLPLSLAWIDVRRIFFQGLNLTRLLYLSFYITWFIRSNINDEKEKSFTDWYHFNPISLPRTSLCKNQTTWEMKIFNSPSNFACRQALRGHAQKCPFKRLQHSCCHGNNDCLFEAWGLIFIQNVAKKSEMFISLSQAKYNITNWNLYHT